ALANAGRVGTDDAQYAGYVVRRNSGSYRGSARRWVRRRHVRIGSVVDIEKVRLGSLKQDLFVCLSGFGQEVGCFANVGPEAFDKGRDLFEDLVGPQGLISEENDDAVGLFEIALDAHFEDLRGHSIRHADAAAAGLVFVGG